MILNRDKRDAEIDGFVAEGVVEEARLAGEAGT